MSSTLEYWLWLGLAFGSANDRTDEIIRRFGSAEAFYRENGAASGALHLTRYDAEHLRAVTLDDAKRVAERMHKAGVDILTPEEEHYPERLRNIYAAPLVLYLQGRLDGLDERLTIAMVGTRDCTEYGRAAAAQIASELARAGTVIVSGLAAGIDAVCHAAAVEQNRPTIAVLGCGIDRNYPVQNIALRRRILETGGAVLTEYAPGITPYAGNFPQRNRIISGLSAGVVVVEAGLRSGSLITANLAAEQGRDVFAVPGSIFSPNSAGTFELLRQGCIPVSCGMDVLEEYRSRFDLHWEDAPMREHAKPMKEPPLQQLVLAGAEPQKPAPEGLSPVAAEVYSALTGALRMEEIAEKLQKPAHEVLTALTELEIMGIISVQAGGYYRRTS